jgi:hypothetical protein
LICHADAKDPRSPTVGEKVGVHGCHSFPPAICPALVGLRSRFAIAPRPHRSAGYPGIIAGRIADRTQALRSTLAACAIATALAALRYLSAPGFWALLVVSLLHAVALAPTINLEHLDALLSDLCGEISRACGCPDGITTDVQRVDVPTDMAIPLALIVNELVTNVVKHVGPPSSRFLSRDYLEPGNKP